VVLTYKAQ